MHHMVLIAKNWPFAPYIVRLLTPRANTNEPIREAFHFSSRKPIERLFVSGLPRTQFLPRSCTKEKSSGIEIDIN